MATLQLANSSKEVSGGKFSWIECWEPRIFWLQVLLVRTIWVKCLGHCVGMWEDSLKGRKRSTRKNLVQPMSISSLMCLKSCCRCCPEDGRWWHLWSLQQPPGRVGNSQWLHDFFTTSSHRRFQRLAFTELWPFRKSLGTSSLDSTNLQTRPIPTVLQSSKH